MKGYDEWLDRNNPTTHDEGLTREEITDLKFEMETEMIMMDLREFDPEDHSEAIDDIKRKFIRDGLPEEDADEVAEEYLVEV